MVIMHNLGADNANRVMGSNLSKQSKVLEKLSSGFKINRAGDNAAGLSISEKMRSQIRGLEQASRNMQDGVSLIQTAEGALNEVHSMVQRIRELSVQAANGTNTNDDKNAIQEEVNQLIKEVDVVSETTSFNGIKLLDGSLKSNSTESLLSNILNSKGNGMQIIYIENSDDFTTIQKGVSKDKDTLSGYDDLKNLLKTEIVPRAVESIVNAYPTAFEYLKDSSIGIGLKLYSNSSSNVLASVGAGFEGNQGVYRLSVNMSSLSFNGDELTEDSRRKLETTIVHEMMHGFMDEALTNGMMGKTSDGKADASNRFPMWFIEGMAQTAAGGYSNDNDWVNSGLRILKDTPKDEITRIVQSSSQNLEAANKDDKGVSEDEAERIYRARYGTGYLACMYLGYLASGSDDITTESLSKGVSNILKKLEDGESLNSVINDVSKGKFKEAKYKDISDFEEQFGDADSANFIFRLTELVKEGNGGLASGNITDSDLLENRPCSTPLFSLDTENDTVGNIYPKDIPVFEGGGSTKNSDGTTTTVPTGQTKPTDPTGPTKPSGSKVPGGILESTNGIKIQAGANYNQTINIEIDGVSTKNLGIDSIVVTTKEEAQKSIDKCDKAIKKVSNIRSNLGAYQNRLEHAMNNVDNSAENVQAAESRIRDSDMASEIMKYSKFNILVQAAQAMLSQSNQSKESVLRLLQ